MLNERPTPWSVVNGKIVAANGLVVNLCTESIYHNEPEPLSHADAGILCGLVNRVSPTPDAIADALFPTAPVRRAKRVCS